MAEAEDLELEAKEGGEGAEGEAPAKGGKGKLIGAVAAVALAGGGFFMYSSMTAEPEAEASAEAESEAGDDGAANPDFLTSGGIHRIDPFLVNLADTEKQRFLRAEFQLVLNSEKDQETIEESELAKATVRHATINLLSSKTSQEIEGHEGRTKLREELRVEIQKALQGIKVADVLLTEFIIQY